MIKRECNLRAGVYKVQAFGTTHLRAPQVLSISCGWQLCDALCIISLKWLSMGGLPYVVKRCS